MLPAVLALFALMVDSSRALPLTVAVPSDSIYDNRYVPWNTGIDCRGISCSRVWPLDRYITSQPSDVLNWAAASTIPGSDLLTGSPLTYTPYPGTVEVSKGNFVRGSATGTTEVGIRDEVTLRPSVLRAPFAPFSSFYPSNFPYNVLRNSVYGYPADSVYSPVVSDYASPLTSSLGVSSTSPLVRRLVADSLYLKK